MIMMISVLTLTACVQSEKTTTDAATEVTATEQTTTELDTAEKQESEGTIAEVETTESNTAALLSDFIYEGENWPIAKSPVAGADNLYELNIPELTQEGLSIREVQSYNEYLLVLVGNKENAKYYLYMIDPLNVKVAASYEFTDEYFTESDAISISDAGEIIVKAEGSGNVYFLDSELREKNKIYIDTIYVVELFSSQDGRYVYYVDTSDDGISRFYQRDTQSDTKTEILTDTVFSADCGVRIAGLVNNDTCIMFSYLNSSEKEMYCLEVRNIADGQTVYSNDESNAVSEFRANSESYSLKYTHGEMNDILFGKNDEADASVLLLTDLEEYRSYTLDMDTMTAVTAQYGENMGEIIFSLYDLNSGRKEKAVTVCGETPIDNSTCTAAYIEDINCCVCVLDKEEPVWFVWDLTKESSKASEDRVYTRDFSDAIEPSEERMVELKARAQSMSEKYDVVIVVGDEIANISDCIYEYKASKDMLQIEHTLNVLDKVLPKYPPGMLAQLEEPEAPDFPISKLHIYCTDVFVVLDEGYGGASGLQMVIDGHNYVVVDICDPYVLETIFYHEIQHALETPVIQKGGFDSAETPWNELNPEGFSYYDNNENPSYTACAEEGEVYFVDVYAKSSMVEDTAQIMASAMLDENDSRREVISHERIQTKLRWICKLYRENYDTTAWPEQTVWEKTCGYVHNETAD